MVIYHRTMKVNMRGSAIVFALGITALVVVLAMAMVMSLRSDLRLTGKLGLMADRQAWISASEAMALHRLNHKDESAPIERSFSLDIDGQKIAGILLDLPPEGAVLDKKIPMKGVLSLLHTTIEVDPVIEVYSLFRKQDKVWQLMYRSHGARE